MAAATLACLWVAPQLSAPRCQEAAPSPVSERSEEISAEAAQLTAAAPVRRTRRPVTRESRYSDQHGGTAVANHAAQPRVGGCLSSSPKSCEYDARNGFGAPLRI